MKSKMNKSKLKERLKVYTVFHKLPYRYQKEIIPYLNDETINILCEAIHNAVNTDLRISKAKKRKIIEKLKACGEKKIKTLCKKKTCIKQRRKYLQEGGFLGALLGAVIPTLVSLISGSVSK